MARRTFRSRMGPRSGRPRRRLEWADMSATLLPIAGTPTLTDLLANLQTDTGQNFSDVTVLRIVGSVQLAAAATVARCGIRVVTEQEDNLDVQPNTFPHQDWMWNSRFAAPAAEHLGGPVANQILDLRGHRRLRTANDTLAFAAEFVAGAPSIAFHTRVLLALP